METKKRVTKHNGRVGKDGVYNVKHNDRNFDTENAKHIDQGRSSLNRYRHLWAEEDLTFEQVEDRFYNENFNSHLEEQNWKYIANRHPERVKTMNDYRTAERTCPEETIMQVGCKDNCLDPELLWSLCIKQIDWEEETFPNVRYLTSSLHCDEEGAPHVHARRVWIAADDNGCLCVSQNKALVQMGIERPDPNKKKGRYNNPKQTYTKLCRDHFIELCKEAGLDIEEVPKDASESGLTLLQYKLNKTAEKLAETHKALNEATEQKQDLEAKLDILSDSIDRYLNVKKKKALTKEDSYMVSKKEYEQFQKDKEKMALDAKTILEAENIEKKMKNIEKAKKEEKEIAEKLYQERKELEFTERQISENEKQLKDQEQGISAQAEIARLRSENEYIKRDNRKLNDLMADIREKINDLDKYINKHWQSVPQPVRELVRKIKNAVNKSFEKRLQEAAMENEERELF